jgi:hypothetical protein
MILSPPTPSRRNEGHIHTQGIVAKTRTCWISVRYLPLLSAMIASGATQGSMDTMWVGKCYLARRLDAQELMSMAWMVGGSRVKGTGNKVNIYGADRGLGLAWCGCGCDSGMIDGVGELFLLAMSPIASHSCNCTSNKT